MTWTVDAEMAIQSEDADYAESLSDGNQRGISQVHPDIGILPHEFVHSLQIRRLNMNELNSSTEDQLPQ